MSKPTGKISWSDEQLAGIRTTGTSLLLSAAAGSGKTAVLAQRCAHLVCDAKPSCDVDQLLVVTFTDAAAAEMKTRIERALRERLGESEDPRLTRQLALVDRAQVSTLHGFCSRLLRSHFHLLGLDPAFTLLDEDEGKLLRLETARQALADRYENDPDGRFARLVTLYGNGNDETLIPYLLKIYELTCSVVEPEHWLQQARQRLEEAASGTLAKSELGRELRTLLESRVQGLRRRCSEAIKSTESFEGLRNYVLYLKGLQNHLDDWANLLANKGIDALGNAVKTLSLPRLSPVKSDVPGKDLCKGFIDEIREEMCGDKGMLATMARFSTAEWQEGMAAMSPLAGAMLDLVEDFAQRYADAKSQSRRLDFNDLERFALQILRDPKVAQLRPSGVARTLHKQFAHVLVDEYQDINQVQDAILYLASRECLGQPAAANLFCVGDVKQSIYRFRLADPHRFLDRYERFKSNGSGLGQVIDLQQNFRSRGPLLGVLNSLFERLMTRDAAEITYDDAQALREGASFPKHREGAFKGSPVELHLLPEDVAPASDDEEELDRSEREAAFVAQRIKSLMASAQVADKRDDVLGHRPIAYRDIVILLRSMKNRADQYANVLRTAGIPVHREGGAGFFDSSEIRDMRALLAVLDNPQQDIPLAAVLRSPLANLPAPEDCLARIRLAYSAPPIPFHHAVPRYAREHEDELAARLRELLELFSQWRQLARHLPLADALWQIYDQTGYLAFCEGLADGTQRVANLIELHERAAQFGSFSRQGLYRFLKFLDSIEADSNIGAPSVQSEAADVVRIMSVHHSKGLEFPVVFLPELGKRFNLADCQGPLLLEKSLGLGMAVADEHKRIRYPSLASVLVQNRLRRSSLAEELRILYVATTRAKEHLILSGTCSDKKVEQWESLWTDYPTPMPPEDFHAATTALDWVGPVERIINDPAKFAVTRHTEEEVQQWTGIQSSRPTLSPLQEKLANLDPLKPNPPENKTAATIVADLTCSYPHLAQSRLEAARSVTDWTKLGREAPVGYVTQSRRITTPFDATLPTPRCLSEVEELNAAEIGTATHTVLQHVNFQRSCDLPGLQAQVRELVDRKLLTPTESKNVDLETLAWFTGTDLGRRLCATPADCLRREMSFYLAVAPKEIDPALLSNDPLDQVMIRGRIDAAIIAPAGLTVIDYKTDRVAPEKVQERADFYAGQVALYRRALTQITSLPVTQVALVFLAPRIILPV